MPEVAARLQHLAAIERVIKTALDQADDCNEDLIGIKLNECLQCIQDRIQQISVKGRL